MSGLDRVRMTERPGWWMSIVIAVLTVMGLLVSWSWWAGGAGRFVLALLVSVALGLAVAGAFRRWQRR